ncbi:response regulator [Desulfobacterales bacterium HSG17]|nr:response regulator [Desulfobacterales bacterium HSG17]
MPELQFRSITSRLIFLFFVVALIPLIAVGTIVYRQRAQIIRSRELTKITIIRDFKIKEINTWLDKRIGDIRTIAGDAEIRKLYDKSLIHNSADKNRGISNEVRKLMNRYLKNYNSFNEIFFINSKSCKIEVSTNNVHEGRDCSKNDYFIKPVTSRDIYIKDIYYSVILNRPSMSFSYPVYSYSHKEQFIGIVVARIDLDRSLYAILLQRTGLGKAGEMVIVNKDLIALNKLRWHENAPLLLKITAESAVQASKGGTGVIETRDYRDEEILAAFSFIPRTRWGIVVKQDIAEAYAPIPAMLRQLTILIILISTAILIIAIFTAKAIAKPVLELTETAGKIRAGDLSARNNIQRYDEFGFLGQVFNEMTDSISSQMNIQKSSSDVTGVMVACKQLKDFCNKTLIKILEVTESDFGAFHLYNEETGFEAVSSIGGNKNLSKSFDRDFPEGQIRAAIVSGKITRIKDIHEDTIFTFKTFAGTAVPREIIAIPVLVDEKAAGIISLARFKDYKKESIKIINLIWPGINTAFSNLLASEKTARMAHELQIKNEEMEAVNEELQAQGHELQLQTQEMKIQAEELRNRQILVEEADRLKSEFLSNMSHELRTPLNSVLVLSRIMLSRGTGKKPDDDAQYLEVIERNGRNLLGLINDILDLSKIESGRMETAVSEFDPREPVEDAVKTVQALAESKGLDIDYNIEDVSLISSDKERIRQILLNLLSNAVKFTHKGKINLTVSDFNDRIEFEVQDTGIGISESDLPHIFKEFRQADGSTTRQYEGTGLGLAISQRVAKLLGGEIHVQSQVDKGSTFILILPLEYKDREKSQEDIIHIPAKRIAESAGDPLKRKILLIDDEPHACEMLKEHLTSMGYDVISVHNGIDGLRLAKEILPFAITLDIFMPEPDGWEVLRQLKSFEETVDIPVVIVSVSSDTATGAVLGAAGYIAKPASRGSNFVHRIIDNKSIGKDAFHRRLESIFSDLEKRFANDSRNRAKILIIEDNEIASMQIKNALDESGFDIMTAISGKEGLDTIHSTKPDAVILDLMMPGMDGFEVLKKIRSIPWTAELPVLVLTAKELSQDEREFLNQANIRQLVQKGNLNKEQIIDCVKNLVRKKSLKEEKQELISKHLPLKSGKSEHTKKNKTILVVEDNPDNMLSILSILKDSDYECITAEDGENAIHMAKEYHPDIILMDIQLPVLSGLDATKQIKADQNLAQIPIIALTAKAMKGDRENILSAGCDDYIAKPLDPDMILERIKNWNPSEPWPAELPMKSTIPSTVS